MQVVYSEEHRRHDPKTYFKGGDFHAHPEVPERADNIAAAVQAAGYDTLEPKDFGPAPRAAVHTPEYLSFLEGIHRRWRAGGFTSEEVVPNVHPGRHMVGFPSGIVGQLGYFTADLSAPIGPATWEAACTGVNVALTATRLVLDGAREAYALARPPGHHAFADQAGGFCFLNNTAISTQYARDNGAGRVAILDVDVHHGNGTQGIYYGRGDVLTVSLHCDPDDFYPFFAGYAHERGDGAGRGANANFPLPRGTGDNAYLAALGDAIDRVRVFAPDLLFVALGLDGYEKDPFDGFRITTAGFGRIARAIGEMGLPTVLVQEGGYNTEDLGLNVTQFLAEFSDSR